MSSKVFDQDQRDSGRDIEAMMYFKNILKETLCIYLTLLILSLLNSTWVLLKYQ